MASLGRPQKTYKIHVPKWPPKWEGKFYTSHPKIIQKALWAPRGPPSPPRWLQDTFWTDFGLILSPKSLPKTLTRPRETHKSIPKNLSPWAPNPSIIFPTTLSQKTSTSNFSANNPQTRHGGGKGRQQWICFKLKAVLGQSSLPISS